MVDETIARAGKTLPNGSVTRLAIMDVPNRDKPSRSPTREYSRPTRRDRSRSRSPRRKTEYVKSEDRGNNAGGEPSELKPGQKVHNTNV